MNLVLKLFLLIVNLLLILIGIAVIRTVLLPEERLPESCLPDDADYISDSQGLSKRLSKAIQFQTVSVKKHTYNEEALFNFGQYIKKTFPLIHSSPFITREVVNNLSLLYHVQGSDASLKPYLLTGHMDVVPVDEASWEVPPFSGLIKDGYIWGRGTIDCKHVVMGSLEALEYLLSRGFKPQRSLYLAYGHDEEVSGLDGAQHICNILKSRNVELEYLLDEGSMIIDNFIPPIKAPIAFVSISEKGALDVELTVEGIAGHSSAPPKETAVVILAKALAKFMKSPIMSATHRTTTAVTVVSGGSKINVLPSSASALVNFRVHPAQTISEALEYLRNVINDERVKIKVLSETPPHPESPMDTFGYLTIKKSIQQIYNDSCVVPMTLIANTDTRWYLDLTKSIYRFSLARIIPSDMKRIHGHNERISVNNYVDVVNFFLHIMKNSDVPFVPNKHTHEDL